MIGDPALGEIVGADALVALAAAHLGLAVLGVSRVLLGAVEVIKARFQHLHGLFFIFQLALFVLTGDHQPGGHVGDAHGGVGAVDVLAAVAGSAISVDADILGLDLHLHVLRLGQHGHGGGGGVDAAPRLGDGHPLDAVYAGFVFHAGKGPHAVQGEHRFLHAAQFRIGNVHRLELKARPLGVALIHAQQQGSEQGRFLPARAGANFHHYAAVVVGVVGDQEQA